MQYYLLSNQLDDERALVSREKGMMTEQEEEHYRGRGCKVTMTEQWVMTELERGAKTE